MPLDLKNGLWTHLVPSETVPEASPSLNKLDPVAEFAQVSIQPMLDLLSPSRIHAARHKDELAIEWKILLLWSLVYP